MGYINQLSKEKAPNALSFTSVKKLLSKTFIEPESLHSAPLKLYLSSACQNDIYTSSNESQRMSIWYHLENSCLGCPPLVLLKLLYSTYTSTSLESLPLQHILHS